VAEAPAKYAAESKPVRPEEAGPPAQSGKAGPRYFCFDCRVAIEKDVARFCWDRKERFGGKAYCRSCQLKFKSRRGAANPSASGA
jgi:hypothetical protein